MKDRKGKRNRQFDKQLEKLDDGGVVIQGRTPNYTIFP